MQTDAQSPARTAWTLRAINADIIVIVGCVVMAVPSKRVTLVVSMVLKSQIITEKIANFINVAIYITENVAVYFWQ